MKTLYAALVAGALAAAAHSASASIVITEVDPFGSNGSNGCKYPGNPVLSSLS